MCRELQTEGKEKISWMQEKLKRSGPGWGKDQDGGAAEREWCESARPAPAWHLRESRTDGIQELWLLKYLYLLSYIFNGKESLQNRR